MNHITVTFVRIYLTESDGSLEKIVGHLHDAEKVRGVTVFRGISGFGRSGQMHSSSLLDVSLDLPLVIEFFDEPEKVTKILQHLESWVEPGHMVHWQANLNQS